jgi:hypothetical protein
MRGLLVLCCLGASAQTDVPKFEQFPATETFAGKPAAPVLRRAKDRLYRTMIRIQAEMGPNFAGRYAVALWGCGSSCNGGALVDEKTGEVLDLPFSVIAVGPGMFGDGEEMVEFKKDSCLFVFRGCPEENNARCGAYYYEWTGSRFKFLKKFGFVPAPKR